MKERMERTEKSSGSAASYKKSTDLRRMLRHKILSHEETVDLIRKAQQGDIAARNRVVEHNMRLVWRYTKPFLRWCRSHTLDDLMSIGSLGLMRAVEKFDIQKGCRFTTYAACWIWRSISNTLSNTDRMIRIPIKKQGKKYQEQKNESTSPKRVSMSAPFSDDGDGCLEDSLFDPEYPDVSEVVDAERTLEKVLQKIIQNAPRGNGERDASILLTSAAGYTFRKTGEMFGGVTLERVRQINKKGKEQVGALKSAYMNEE